MHSWVRRYGTQIGVRVCVDRLLSLVYVLPKLSPLDTNPFLSRREVGEECLRYLWAVVLGAVGGSYRVSSLAPVIARIGNMNRHVVTIGAGDMRRRHRADLDQLLIFMLEFRECL